MFARKNSGVKRHAFTLIELLLVVAILGVAAAVTLPSFVRSMRGNRLRTAAQTVVMAGRYARSMAVLQQREMAVTFDLAGGAISVAGSGAAPARKEDEDTGQDVPAPPPTAEEFGGEARQSRAHATGEGRLSRKLDRVSIDWVELEDGPVVNEGLCTVVYHTNGRCTPYTVRIVDEEGSWVTVEVDALSTATTESG